MGSIRFNDFNCSLGFITKMKDGSVDLEKGKENQEKYKSTLHETTYGKRQHKSEERKSTINILKIFYKARKKATKLFDHYTAIRSKAKYEAKNGKGPRLLTTQQMSQRLQIACAQEKAGNTTENLLNKIGQIIYFFVSSEIKY